MASICHYLLVFVGIVYQLVTPLYAQVFELPKAGYRLVGENIIHQAQHGDYFQQLAEQYNVGFLALMAANPEVDPFLLKANEPVTIPHQMLLPYGKREGIVVNLAELRLYYFVPDKPQVYVFPIGIGRIGLQTPNTVSYISEKRKDPVWRPTAEMKERYFKEHGVPLADEIPPGKNNPFGKYALRIGLSEYLLHGTNQRFGIGMRASSGCIRLYDEDIEWLYNNIALDTPIRIMEQPIKMSYEGGQQKWLEIHQPLSDMNDDVYQRLIEKVRHFVGDDLSQQQLSQLLTKPSGLVYQIR